MAAEKPHMELDPKYDHYDFPTTSPNKHSGHPGHTTPEQDAQVFQLRMMLEQAGYTERLDTLTLVCMRSLGLVEQDLTSIQLRFLRARKFDVQLSEKMYVFLDSQLA
jgi:hypothetical protein